MVAVERYQIHCSSNPGWRERITAGIETSRMRVADAIIDGIVLPIAWNMLEFTKTSPERTKLHDMTLRYSTPTATTSGSLEKMRIMAAGTTWKRIASRNITPT